MTDKVVRITEDNIEEFFPEVKEYREAMGSDGIERMLNMVDDFSEDLRNDWEQIRNRDYNPSRKGGEFEKTIKDFLETYFTSVFEFHIGCFLVDSELRSFKEFDPKQNEFDIVSLFRTATPNIVFKEGDMNWVPYDGVAFVGEVKSHLSKPNLKKDLSKLDTLKSLRGSPSERFPKSSSGTDMMVPHQLHCLVYDKNEIDRQTRKELFYKYPDAWDLCLIVEEDKLLLNSTLPLAHHLFNRESQNGEFKWCHIRNGLLWLIVALSVSIPHPPVVYTTNPLVKMASFMGVSTGGGHFKS